MFNVLCSKDAKLLKTLKFPKEYDLKVDFNKVNWEVMKGWIAKRVTELLGLEDEVVIGYVFEQLENKQAGFLRRTCQTQLIISTALLVGYTPHSSWGPLMSAHAAGAQSQAVADQLDWILGEEYKPVCEGKMNLSAIRNRPALRLNHLANHPAARMCTSATAR